MITDLLKRSAANDKIFNRLQHFFADMMLPLSIHFLGLHRIFLTGFLNRFFLLFRATRRGGDVSLRGGSCLGLHDFSTP